MDDRVENEDTSNGRIPPQGDVHVDVAVAVDARTKQQQQQQQKTEMRDVQDDKVLNICRQCGTIDTSLLTCSYCRLACYCSPECQKQNWTTQHKASCRVLQQHLREKKRKFLLFCRWASTSMVALSVHCRSTLAATTTTTTTTTTTVSSHAAKKKDDIITRSQDRKTFRVVVTFNYNQETFVPVECEQIMGNPSSSKHSLAPEEHNYETAIVRFGEYELMMPIKLDFGLDTKETVRNDTNKVNPVAEIVAQFPKLQSSIFGKEEWSRTKMYNLTCGFSAWLRNGCFLKFVTNSLYISRGGSGRFKDRVMTIEFCRGGGLGEVGCPVAYRVCRLRDIRQGNSVNRIPGTFGLRFLPGRLESDIEKAQGYKYVSCEVLSDDSNDLVTGIPFKVPTRLLAPKNKALRKYDREADRLFQILKTMAPPAVVESPDLDSGKMPCGVHCCLRCPECRAKNEASESQVAISP